MNNAKQVTRFERHALRMLGFCALGVALGLPVSDNVAAATTTLSDTPMVLVTPMHPQVLLLLNNSQSMDGNLSGAIMTGASGTYTVPNGFTPPVDGSANYTVTVSGQKRDNSASRMNVAKASIKQILNDYASSNDFGLMTLTTSGTPALYNTWVYYMSAAGGFTFTDTADTDNGTTYPNPCYQITSSACTSLAGRYGSGVSSKPYFVAAGSSDGKSNSPGSSDDPQVNDVLYAGSLPSAFVSYSGPTPANPYTGYTLSQYNSGSVFEGYSKTLPSIGSFGTSPTNAGYVPYSPEVLYVSRGFGYYNSVAATTGTLRVPIAPDTAARETTFSTLLAPETNSATSGEIKSNAVNAATAGMLTSAYNYYTGTAPAAPGVTATSPPPNNKNNNCATNKYVVLITDGLPTWDLAGKAWPPLGSLAATGYGVTATISNQVLTGTNSQAVNDTLDKIKALKAKNILTYVIGMGAAVDNKNSVAAATLSAMAIAGGTDSYFPASSPADVSNDMVVILEKIKAANATTTSAAVNSGNVKTTSNVYQATFSSQDTNRDWTGDLVAYPFSGGKVGSAVVWDAQDLLDAVNWDTGRHIVSFNPTTGKGIPFRWPASATDTSALNTTQQGQLQPSDSLGSSRLNYLRGDRSSEQTAGTFRKRTHVLGDITDSTPLYIGAPSGPYQDASYQSFEASNSGRDPMIYVGANDGMLHAFCATTTTGSGHCTPGAEMFAFIPNGVFGQLINLTQPAYNTAHRFFVDGSPSSGDAKFSISDSNWHTLLVGGLNNGGNSIYALDVTTPPSAGDTEAAIAKKVLWEYTDSNLGRTFSRPTIARLSNGKSAVIFGSGYNNSDGKPYLYILDAETGSPLFGSPIDLCGNLSTCDANKPNGLSSPAAVSPDASGTVTLVYAGDLQGNLWKVDLTAQNVGGSLLFKAVDAGGTAQPITTTPVVSLHPNAPTSAGYMVYFGTGQFLGLPDISTTSPQTIYGIWDDPKANKAAQRSDLVAQTITGTPTATTLVSGTNSARLISSKPIDWTSQRGWYIDLPISGERAITDALLDSKRLIFATFIPSTDPCTGGGQSWFMVVDYATGGAPSQPQIDLYGNGTFDFLKDSSGKDKVPVGMLFNYAIAAPTLISGTGGSSDTILISGSTSTGGSGGNGGSGGYQGATLNIRAGSNGRESWIQLQ